MDNKKLAKIRENIDDIDQEIIGLLAKRNKLAKDLAKVKVNGQSRDYKRDKKSSIK